MEILIGIVLVLLAFKLIAELAGFFIGMFVGAKIAKLDIFNEDKDKDKQYEDIHAICSSHDCNNNNIGGYMMHMLMTAIGLLLVVVSVEMHPDLMSMELAMLMSIIGIVLVYIPLINERSYDADRDRN